MLKEQDCLHMDLESAEAQIKSLHSQNFANKLELQRAKAKLNQYDPKYRRPEPELVQKYEQCRHAWEKCQEKII